MNQAKTGKFISVCRKKKKLTQAQLAEKLNITDRAVSKWETGKSMPDASIMLELCEIFGITVNELLSGEKACTERYEKKTDENLTVQKRTDNNILKKNIIISAVFSATLLTGIIVCLICDFAISGTLTWSSIPISSSVMAWLITFPSIIFGKKGIKLSLISLSIFTVPYLYLLSIIIKVKNIFSIGTPIPAASIVFLWLIFAVFIIMGKTRKQLALGITFLSAIPFIIIINTILSGMIDEPHFDIWDILSFTVLFISAFISFICYYLRKRERKCNNID